MTFEELVKHHWVHYVKFSGYQNGVYINLSMPNLGDKYHYGKKNFRSEKPTLAEAQEEIIFKFKKEVTKQKASTCTHTWVSTNSPLGEKECANCYLKQ